MKPDGPACYDLGIACLREANIRLRNILPRQDHPDELRWASEGMPRRPDGTPDFTKLETGRRG